MRHVLVTVFVLVWGPVNADVPTAQKAEVEHLLNFVEQSACLINRNGKVHGGVAAAAHIKKKYAYFKDEIETSEQFIELSASKSTLSGKYYTVQCGEGEQVRTREWLLDELARYRGGGNS